MPESRCGLLCAQCSYCEQMNCSDCVHMSKPFWGDSCPVKSCCEGKGKAHCGTYDSFLCVPCELLRQFAYDPKQGDNGKCIEQYKVWSKAGAAV